MIPVLKPDADDRTKKEMLEVLDSGWWGCGPKVKQFEEMFAKRVGSNYCVATNSCTSALDLCLKAYGLDRGELITTPMTFVSDAIVGEWNGMDVTFADIDEDTLCIDPDKIEFTPNTAAVIAVDSHGRLADIKGIRDKFKGLVIEDAAHACHTPGAGRDAEITVWSFQAVKTLPAGDGGAITTNNEEIYNRLKSLIWLGVERSTYDRVGSKGYSWEYDIKQASGIKAYMTDLTAVLCIGNLRRIDDIMAKRRDVQALYNDAFSDIEEIKIPEHSHTVQYYTMQCEDRNGLSEYLAENGVSTSVHFKPLNQTSYWRKAEKTPLEVTNRVWPKLLTLPVYNSIHLDDVCRIAELVRKYYVV